MGCLKMVKLIIVISVRTVAEGTGINKIVVGHSCEGFGSIASSVVGFCLVKL